jgi:uncharacterized membrane protein YbhN (UPF0104 family)
MKKTWMNVLRVAVSIGALAFLVWNIDLAKTLDELRRVDLGYLLVAFLLFLLSLVVRAWRWFVLVRSLDPKVCFRRLLHLYFVGQFFSSFLPTAFGGDVVRAAELTQDTDPSAAIGTVLLDRMLGLMVNFGLGLVLLPLTVARMEPWLVGALVAIAGGGLALGVMILEGRIIRRLTRGLPGVLSLAGEGPLAKIYAAVTNCGRRAVLSALQASLVFNVINVIINWLCGLAVGTGISLGYFFVVTPLISVSLLVPSVGGWGVRELVSTAVFASVSAEKAAMLGVSLGLIALAAGLVGGGIYLIDGARGMLAARRETE